MDETSGPKQKSESKLNSRRKAERPAWRYLADENWKWSYRDKIKKIEMNGMRPKESQAPLKAVQQRCKQIVETVDSAMAYSVAASSQWDHIHKKLAVCLQ